MPKMGSLAAQDDVQFAPYGVGSSAETANAPSGMGALASGAYQYLGDLAKRAFGASEQMRMGGTLNPAPMVEAAMLPMTGAVAGTGPGGFAVGAGPIKAYHSSPHDFDKFDLAKIGTGEGAQVYGHGLYFAENPAVSGQGGQYWKQFLNRFKGEEKEAARKLWGSNFDREAAAKAIQEAADRYTVQPSKYVPASEVTQRKAELLRQHELLTSGKPVGPRTYEVDIHADPAHMLDWDKPLRGHTEPTRESLFNALDEPAFKDMTAISSYRRALEGSPLPVNWEPTGQNLYEAMRGTSRTGRAKDLAVPASEALNMSGIPGIKYLDQGSRMPPPSIIEQINAKQQAMMIARKPETRAVIQAEIDALKASIPQGTSNYVIFDPSIVDIMKKYGIAGAAPAGMGALAAQDTYKGD